MLSFVYCWNGPEGLLSGQPALSGADPHTLREDKTIQLHQPLFLVERMAPAKRQSANRVRTGARAEWKQQRMAFKRKKKKSKMQYLTKKVNTISMFYGGTDKRSEKKSLCAQVFSSVTLSESRVY